MSAVVKAIYKPLSLATSVLGGIAAAWCSNGTVTLLNAANWENVA